MTVYKNYRPKKINNSWWVVASAIIDGVPFHNEFKFVEIPKYNRFPESTAQLISDLLNKSKRQLRDLV